MKLVKVTMVRENLDGIPNYAVPPPYSIRRYHPGDEKTWATISGEADKYTKVTPELFESQFGKDIESLKARQFFLCDAGGGAIGTATAWFDNDYHGRKYGRVHWVAIVPPMQGKGLSKPLLSAVCNCLRELGHVRAYLGTQTVRIPAINLYLKFGFVPEMRSEADAKAWREVRDKLGGGALDCLNLDGSSK